NRVAAGGPWVRQTDPGVMLSQNAGELILQGEGLGAGTSITVESGDTAILADRANAAGDLRILTLDRIGSTDTLVFRVTNAAGASRFRVQVLDGSAPL